MQNRYSMRITQAVVCTSFLLKQLRNISLGRKLLPRSLVLFVCLTSAISLTAFQAAAQNGAQLYIADNFDNHNFSPLWSYGTFIDSYYSQDNQSKFVDFEGHGGVVHYYLPVGVDDVTPAQMGLEGSSAFSRVTGQETISESYFEWSEYFPQDHDFADIAQKLLRFTYWGEGESRGAEVTVLVNNDNGRTQIFLYHPAGLADGSPLDLGLDGPPIPVGQWVRLGLSVRLNTPGQSDGFVQLLVNGEPTISQANMSIRGTDTRGWNSMWLGGNHSNNLTPTSKASSRFIDDVQWYSTKPDGSTATVPQQSSKVEPLLQGEVENRRFSDFNRDGISDYAVFRPSTGEWYVRMNSVDGGSFVKQWGLPGDKPLQGDYDGDGLLDLTVWRPTDGTWYICQSGENYDCANPRIVQFGLPGDYPVAGDIDGDGIADLVVWRPALGQWYLTKSSDGSFDSIQFGLPEDIPALADFNGDGSADLAVFRPSTGMWFRKSIAGESLSEVPLQWGLPGDRPMAADYDGDGKADPAVWRPSNGTWYLCLSKDNAADASTCTNGRNIQFGLPADQPVLGTFDGSGAASLAVWRPSSGNWYTLGAASGQIMSQQWGLPLDLPIGAN